ncbi:MAG: hypothetical protein ACHQ17_11550 [Polyangia bacterium]
MSEPKILPKKPRLLVVLGALGLVLGAFGIMFSVAQASSLLVSRDDYVTAIREAAEKQIGNLPPKLGTKDELTQLMEKRADVVYSRRKVALPLAAVNVILSFLLFAGCARALRGQSWGLSAWMLAALASIPYNLIDCALALVQSNDLRVAFHGASGPLGEFARQWVSVESMTAMLKTSVELLYFGICVVYLRRPEIQARFTPPPSTSA